MSSMLEQAIVDAAALREAALKNAEQAIIEKYAPQIKEAVEEMLENEGPRWSSNQLVRHEGKYARITTESDDGKVGIQYLDEEKTNLVLESDLEEADETLLEQEMGDAGSTSGAAAPAPSGTATIPLGSGNVPDGNVDFTMTAYEFDPADFDVDLETLHLSDKEQEKELQTGDSDMSVLGDEDTTAAPDEATTDESPDDILGDLGGELEDTEPLLEEDLMKEIMSLLGEDLTVDMGETKKGHIVTDEGTLKYEQEKQLAAEEDDELKEENEEYKKKIEELDEALTKSNKQNKDFLKIIDELSNTLNETLLSNAKLLYCNKTLSDASLNERQKHKIVEAIAKAKTPEQAKTLQETLKATVGTTKKDGPQSLSESVNRKSNLSSVLPRRKQPEQQYSFADHMKKLAGIK